MSKREATQKVITIQCPKCGEKLVLTKAMIKKMRQDLKRQ